MQIVLGVSASAACYKACVLASRLTQAGCAVDVVLTPHAAQLIAPRLFSALTGRPALSDEFAAEATEAMSHIALADRAELFLVAPATAATIAKLALAQADDLLSTLALALRPETPRWIAPAMNPRMFQHAGVQQNLRALVAQGWRHLEPEAGWLACGDHGPGRMMEPEQIAQLCTAWRDERARGR
jgi:phosphopantothenoylcysteine decarboxylase/phosphopantothenate--cysteine ligase